MRYYITALLALTFSIQAYSVDNLRIPSIRSIAMGGNISTQSPLSNPALLVDNESSYISIGYLNRFMIKELGNISASFIYPNRILTAAVDISAFGYDKYREMMARVSLAKRLNNRWALGVGFHYSLLQSELYDNGKSRISTDIGATFKPFDNLLIGMLIMNLPSVSLGDDDIDIDDFNYYIVEIGFQWHIINSMLIAVSVGSDKDNSVVGDIGVEYNPFKTFHIRTGIKSSPLLPSFGVGYGFSHFKIDASAIYHPVLGVSTAVGISFNF